MNFAKANSNRVFKMPFRNLGCSPHSRRCKMSQLFG